MPRPPKTFNQFIGQTRVVRYVERLVRGAADQVEGCLPLLFVGAPGMGKTSLAEAIAEEVGSVQHRLFAGVESQSVDICRLLFQLRHGDVLLLDEAHSLRADPQQVLFGVVDKCMAPKITDGRLDRSCLQSVAAFTLVLSTSTPGGLQRALRDRLIPVEFDRYSTRELKAIARRVSFLHGIEVTGQAARLLSEVAQGSPRRLEQRIQVLKLFWPRETRFTGAHIAAMLKREGIDQRGVSPHQRLYLEILSRTTGQVCSLERIAIGLGCDPAYVSQVVEPFLIDSGFVEVGPGGRSLTPEGQLSADGAPQKEKESIIR
jgi:Holliday junction DNA helicase RuvB